MKFTEDYTTCLIPTWKHYLSEFKDKPCEMLEVGVFQGRSAVWFLENILTHPESSHTAVDNFKGGEDQIKNGVDCSGLYERYLENTKQFVGKRSIFIDTSDKALSALISFKCKFDLIYIDASHFAENVTKDLENSWKLLNKGGVLIADDYSWNSGEPGQLPKVAIDKWLSEHKGEYELLYLDLQMIVRKNK